MEPESLACSHWPDVLEAVNHAAVAPDGRARVGPVRAKRDPESPRWTIDPPERVPDPPKRVPALSEWGLFGADQLIARLRAHSAEAAREIFRERGLGRQGDRVRRVKHARFHYLLTSRAHALRHPCPNCGAEPDEPCARRNGENTRIACHAERHATPPSTPAPRCGSA